MALTGQLSIAELSHSISSRRRTSGGATSSLPSPALSPVSRRALHKELSGRSLRANQAACAPSRSGPLRVEAAKRVSTGRSLVLNSTLIAEEGKGKEVEQLCYSVLSLAADRQKSKGSGILSFECHTDAYEGNVVHFWERYDTFLAMNDFHASPQYTDFLYKVRPLLVQPVQLSAYEYKDGQIGCMLNPIGPKGEGGLDDATGQGGSGGGASYKQTSQSVSQGISENREWGLENAVESTKTKNAALDAAAAIAKSFRSIFGAAEKKE